ncbi:hypothetical protein A2765_00780 [Candidatus Kaiserbacteria bacterium RIFCSPHIGHO2_01_FULL_56_24]|uniref:Uncharacterized protein n=1 Tax=Candidatus Kaiserbacteria bacterium RIFCSPHIGHO2_01_FULL_56_24 TaxID=1798487 RepID=A0A1F6DEY9_9BACT|nr:MAG: hypothetical protein A2765_00780 [Candidatus Kaiserbacteria bacterium RIFCSPHIGHO2_01_FULL_56_24]
MTLFFRNLVIVAVAMTGYVLVHNYFWGTPFPSMMPHGWTTILAAWLILALLLSVIPAFIENIKASRKWGA